MSARGLSLVFCFFVWWARAATQDCEYYDYEPSTQTHLSKQPLAGESCDASFARLLPEDRSSANQAEQVAPHSGPQNLKPLRSILRCPDEDNGSQETSQKESRKVRFVDGRHACKYGADVTSDWGSESDSGRHEAHGSRATRRTDEDWVCAQEFVFWRNIRLTLQCSTGAGELGLIR